MEGHYDKTNYINGEDKTTERSRKNKKHSERPVGNVGYRIVVDFGRNLHLYIEYIEGEKNLKNKLYTRYTQEHGQLKLSKKGK